MWFNQRCTSFQHLSKVPDLSKWVTTSCSQWLLTIKDYIWKIVCKTTINTWLFCILNFFPLFCCLLSFLLLSQSFLIVPSLPLLPSSHTSTSRFPPFSHSQVSVSVSYCYSLSFAQSPATFPSYLFIWGNFIWEQGNTMPPRGSLFFYMFQWSCFPPHFLFTPFT